MSRKPQTYPALPQTIRSELDTRHFTRMLGLALLAHVLVVVWLALVPHDDLLTVPVYSLNIKLGNSEPLTSQPADPAAKEQQQAALRDAIRAVPVKEEALPPLPKVDPPAPSPQVVDALDKMLQLDKAPAKPKTSSQSAVEAVKKSYDARTAPLPKADAPTKYVRAQGSALGNSTARDAEVMARYEQMISLWIQKFKTYPEEARGQGIQGEAVLRLRITRGGQVQYYSIDKSTGSALLDRSVLAMVQRANPVPAVPDDYPPGQLLEFLVPVSFKLE